MNFCVQRSELRDLHDKVAAGERISEADALRLFESKDLNALGAIADLARQKKVGNRASYKSDEEVVLVVRMWLAEGRASFRPRSRCSFAQEQFPLGDPVSVAEVRGHRKFLRRARNLEQLEAGLVRETVGLALVHVRRGPDEVFP